jgi:hypothetical protein
MKRFFSCTFLFLYLYNIVGYLAVFSVVKYRVREEVKAVLKGTVPHHELLTLTFHTESLLRGEYALQWIEPHEFRYNGSMYDIIQTSVDRDSTSYVCINDVQEERLFAHLDNHVQRHMGDSGQPAKFDSFKDVFKDSLTRSQTLIAVLPLAGIVPAMSNIVFHPFVPDGLFHPPRLLS